MCDDDLKARWATVTDPLEALKELLENSCFLGSDPYYRDLNDALMEMVERVIELNGRDDLVKVRCHPDLVKRFK